MIAKQTATRRYNRQPKKTLFAFLLGMDQLRRERQSLQNLDNDSLADIGITRAQAITEARKPIWQLPEQWHHR